MGNSSSNSSHNNRIASQEAHVNKELSKIKSGSSYNSNKYTDNQIRGALRQDYNNFRSKSSNDYVMASDYNKMLGRK
jgi:hypothetical protein